MFFKLRMYEKSAKSYSFSKDCIINNESGCYSDYISTVFKEKINHKEADAVCTEITFKLGFPKSLKDKIKAKTPLSESDEAYAIVIGDKTTVYAVRARSHAVIVFFKHGAVSFMSALLRCGFCN